MQSVPQSSGGLSRYYLSSAASTNGTNVKAGAGALFGYTVTNSNASARYLRFYNTAGTPTVGTTATYIGVMVPGSGGVVMSPSSIGVDFSTGIAISLTTGAADTDTGAVAADEIKLTLFYK